MAATWTLMALLGLGVVFELFPTLYAAARIAGAAYLLYLAYGIWKDASAPVEARAEPARGCLPTGLPHQPAQPEIRSLRGGRSRRRVPGRD